MREILLLLLLAALVAVWLIRQQPPPGQPGALDVSALLAGDAAGFKRIEGPAPVVFPDDHAAHPEYRHEWWYFTGNLDDLEGRRYGFQFTLFRFAVDAQAAGDSAWRADQRWMAHLALSDGSGERFIRRERFARGALNLAGATADHWWLKDWQVTANDDGWHLEARTGEFDLDLQLQPAKPHVLQGEHGYSRKGPEAGNASRYISWPRLQASGTLELNGRPAAVNGLAWLDREWGSGALANDVAGWDWFALQLADGRDLMYYHLRRHDGSASPFSAGVLVDTDGKTVHLSADDIEARPQKWWRDDDGNRWPVAWRLTVPNQDLNLTVQALFDHQFWDGRFRYWEGAVDVFADDKTIGRGYLETTGY